MVTRDEAMLYLGPGYTHHYTAFYVQDERVLIYNLPSTAYQSTKTNYADAAYGYDETA